MNIDPLGLAPLNRDLEPLRRAAQPEYSEWVCYLFGARKGSGMAWRPKKGEEPNRLQRFLQRVFFGNTWTKEPEEPEPEFVHPMFGSMTPPPWPYGPRRH